MNTNRIKKKHNGTKGNGLLKIAVISDMHAWDDKTDKKDGSWLKMGMSEEFPNEHPITGLIELITEKEKIKADYLLCCGDMAEKANPKALIYAWNQVEKIKKAISAKAILATSGNHDADSRFMYNSYDAKGMLQSLNPPFPLEEESLRDKYWANNYVIIDKPNCRFVILNSSAYHGSVSEGNPPEYYHGRISPRTILSLERELGSRKDSKDVNILLCHHHPHKHNDITVDDYSEMKDGTRLLDLLGSGKYGRWVVIHGHKHHPRLCYAAGTSSSPVIFSAGSLCAQLYSKQQAKGRNQFYVIEFPYGKFSDLGLEIAGSFRSWDWIIGDGWQVADHRSGLPGSGGFGYQVHLSVVAKTIYEFKKKSKAPFLNWKDILKIDTKLDFLSPGDITILIGALKSNHNLNVQTNENGTIYQIG